MKKQELLKKLNAIANRFLFGAILIIPLFIKGCFLTIGRWLESTPMIKGGEVIQNFFNPYWQVMNLVGLSCIMIVIGLIIAYYHVEKLED
jgi:hypothetical protein